MQKAAVGFFLKQKCDEEISLESYVSVFEYSFHYSNLHFDRPSKYKKQVRTKTKNVINMKLQTHTESHRFARYEFI